MDSPPSPEVSKSSTVKIERTRDATPAPPGNDVIQKHRVVGRGLASVLLRFSGAGISFVLSVALARALGVGGFGVYSFAMALVTLVAMVAQLGLPTLVVRETSRYRSHGHWSALRGLLQRALQLTLGSSLALLLVLSIFLTVVDNARPAVEVNTALIALFLVPVIALNNVFGACLRGLGFAIKGQLSEQLFRPGIFLAILGAALVIDRSTLNPTAAMSMHVVAALGAFCIGAAMLLQGLPDQLRRGVSDFGDSPAWRRGLLPFSILAGLQVINSQVDILMLGMIKDAEDVGLYRVAHQAASIINMTLFAVGLTVEPTIARLHALGDRQNLQRVVTTTARMAFMVSLVMTALLVVFGREIIRGLFGEEFVSSFIPLAILCVGQVGLAYAGWAVIVLNMSGHERGAVALTAIAAVTNIAANALLIPPYGMSGAAIATALTTVSWKVGLAILAQRRTGIRTFAFTAR